MHKQITNNKAAPLSHMVLLIILIFALCFGGSGLSPAQAQDTTWAFTSALSTPRRYHTATLLPNGHVLVVGGENDTGTVLSSAEIYDPISGAWRLTANMSVPRADHTATLLPNGKVLVVGGRGPSSMHPSAELFDPLAGTWSPASSMSNERALHTASLYTMSSDMIGVVVIGGWNSAYQRIGDTEVYNPLTNSWTKTTWQQISLIGHTAMMTSDNFLLLTGGKGNSEYYDNLLLFNPSTGMFTNFFADMLHQRMNHTATPLADGRMLVVGGSSEGSVLNSVEAFTRGTTNSWSDLPNLTTPRAYHTSTILPNGKVVIIGGYNQTGDALGAEIYDSQSNTWSAGGNLNQGRRFHTSTLLSDGRVLVVGGWSFGTQSVVATSEIRGFSTPSWTSSAAMSTPRTNHGATLLADGRVLLAGGINGSTYLRTADVYVPNTNTWSASVGQMYAERAAHSLTLLNNGSVLAAGGRNSTSSLGTAEVFQPLPQMWSTTNAMTSPRHDHTATLLADGRVLVTGGTVLATPVPQYYSSAELYHPDSSQWTAAAGNMISTRTRHTATLLKDGRVLIVGGYNGGSSSTSYVATAEIFNPGSGDFIPAGSLTARSNHTATLLSDGRVLVVGGINRTVIGSTLTYLSNCRIYDPTSNLWSNAGDLVTGRANHTATLLADGRVLVVGGLDQDGAMSDTELYDPATNTWAYITNLKTYRYNHTATLLPNGQLFAAGGDELFTLSSTEKYDRGLGQVADWRPILTNATDPLPLGWPLVIEGTGLRGISEGSGSNGGQHSASNIPVVQLRRLDNGQISNLYPANGSFSQTHFVSLPLSDFNPGYALLTVFANGIPSLSKIILVNAGSSSAPMPFGKSTPENGAVNPTASLSLTWGISTGAISYDFCYDTSNNNSCSHWEPNGLSRVKNLSGLNPGTTYYWQVRAINNAGTTYADGSSSHFWNFTIFTQSIDTFLIFLPLVIK